MVREWFAIRARISPEEEAFYSEPIRRVSQTYLPFDTFRAAPPVVVLTAFASAETAPRTFGVSFFFPSCRARLAWMKPRKSGCALIGLD